MPKLANTIIPPGYRVSVTSWENDADNYKTNIFEGLTKERVEFLAELLPHFYSGSNNRGKTFGNMYEPSDSRYAEAATRIREVMERHRAGLTEDELEILDEAAGIDLEDATKGRGADMYSFGEIVGEFLSYSEDYTFRVFESMKVEFVPHEIRMQDVTKEFKIAQRDDYATT